MDIDTAQLVFGIVLVVVGVGLIYWINRRKFYRRNAMGAEGFSSFEASIFIRLIEWVGRLLALALIAFGAVNIWTYNQMKKDKEKQNMEIINNSK